MLSYELTRNTLFILFSNFPSQVILNCLGVYGHAGIAMGILLQHIWRVQWGIYFAGGEEKSNTVRWQISHFPANKVIVNINI